MRLLHPNRPVRPAVLPAVVAVLLLALVSGCTQDTHDPISPGIGNSDREAPVIVLSAALVTDGHGHGTVVGTISNTTSHPDRLVDVSITSEHGQVPATLPSQIPLGADESVRLGESAGIAIRSDKLDPGQLFELHLHFASAGEVSLKVPVERQQDGYADVEIPS